MGIQNSHGSSFHGVYILMGEGEVENRQIIKKYQFQKVINGGIKVGVCYRECQNDVRLVDYFR